MATSPFKTLALPLTVSAANRGDVTTFDAKLVNGYWEPQEDQTVFVVKRPGMVKTATLSGMGYGLFTWNNDVYSIFGTSLYKNAVLIGTVDTTGGQYTWSSCLGATHKLFFHNASHAYTYDSTNGLVQVTNSAYPGTTVPGAVYLDGTMYVMDGSANIYGSNINDPQTWSSLNMITAQIEPLGGIGLAKQLVYVIAFKPTSVEVFYDQANPTGSPLGTVQGAKVNYGCRHAGSIQDIDGTLCWISTNRSGSVGVMVMEGLKAQQIDTPAIARLLQDLDYTTVYSWQARVGGHRFYVVTVKNGNLTLAYDLVTQRWSQWTDTNGNYVPIVASTYNSAQQVLLQHETDGDIYQFVNTVYQDDGAPIQVDLYTPPWDADTRVGKFASTMYITADQTAGSMLTVSTSDDDYQTWTQPRYVDLGQPNMTLDNMATFSRRAHHFRHVANTPFRLKRVEINVELCSI
jgi:hypothetical protein